MAQLTAHNSLLAGAFGDQFTLTLQVVVTTCMYPPKVVNVGVSKQYKEWQRSGVLTWSHGRTACRAKTTSAHELHTPSLPSTAHVSTELRLYSTACFFVPSTKHV